MPGIDSSRFVGIDKIGEDLTCGICLAIFVEPLVTQCCEQMYCNDCIKEWLKTNKTCPNDRKGLSVNALIRPPRFVLNMISKLKITCDFSGNGCEEVISYGGYKAHVKRCRYNPDALCIDCGIKNGVRAEHNCVRLLFASNQTLQAINGEFSDSQRVSNEVIKRLQKKLNDKENDIKRYKLDINKLEQEKRVLQQKVNDLVGRVAQSSHDTRNGVSVSQVVPVIETPTHNNINNTHKFQFILTAVNINDLTSHLLIDSTIDSDVSRINGFRWKITATKENSNQLEFLGLYLVCESESNAKVWSRNVDVNFIIIPQTPDYNRLVQHCGPTLQHTFNVINAQNYILWSFPKFILWQFVSEEIYGFVKNDNIIIEAQLTFID